MLGTTYGERSRSPYRASGGMYGHSHSRPSSPSRQYDLGGGGWRAEGLSPGNNYGDDYYNPNAYDHELYSPYYGVEDDYYGAYGDLLEYEENLRLAADLSEAERLRRWQDRLAFEELAEAERLRRYELMAEEERLRLGLIGSAWWARRYGGRHGHGHSGRHTPSLVGGWKGSYGDRLRRWTPNRLPLSSSLTSRFERIWGGAQDRRRRLSVAAGATLEMLAHEQRKLEEELRAVREEARLRELALEQSRRRVADEIARERERERAEAVYRVQKAQHEQRELEVLERNRRAQDAYREELRRYENERTRADIERTRMQNEQLRHEVVSSLQSQEQELRLRRELELAGSGLYKY